MTHRTLWLLVALVVATPASAHFLWVVPESDGRLARVIVSETLAVDPRVDIAIVAGAQLMWHDRSGRESPVNLTRAGHVFTVPIAASGIAHGHADLGVRPSGDRAYRLHYYPKTIVGNPYDAVLPPGRAPIEIVPAGTPGATRLRVLVNGRPAADVDVNLVLPDGSESVVQTDENGLTAELTPRGRYGAWARYWEQVSGEFQGTAFGHTRHYATLVFETEAGASTTSRAPSAAVDVVRVA